MSRGEAASRPRPWRRRLVLAGWLAAAAVICARAGQVQLVEGAEWKRIAEAQHRSNEEVAAPRGAILDRDGTPLAVSRERLRVSVAGRELTDPAAARGLLEETLELSPSEAARTATAESRWRQVPGSFAPSVRERLQGVRGVYLDPVMERFLPHGLLARGLVGVVRDNAGAGGIEQAFDEVLRGRAGSEVVARDPVGNAMPGETFLVEAPITGGQVVLTVDVDLQEIAAEALGEAVERTGARGGDVLVTDPRSGEILALVSVRDGSPAALSAINAPYEPGSTLKPFTVTALLRDGLAELGDTVDVEDGTWDVEGRTLHDVHTEGRMTVADALRVSSNVGVAKAAAPLSHRRQYENLRDFGFGAPTGVPLPGEAPGTLRRPVEWSRQSAVSLAIGYEIAVTPLQMAMAYGALANGGLLMEPRLVREIRGPEGHVVERLEPRVVRRVAPEPVVRAVSQVLVDVVEDGTGTSARLDPFLVAGKSGTSRAPSSGGGYESGAYYSSFVGFFPADDPQLLVFVRLERPHGQYYGGQVAAPVTRATLEAALAARATPLDRGALLRSVRRVSSPPSDLPARFAARQPLEPPAPPTFAPPEGVESDRRVLSVPDVSGLPIRVAVRRLHAAGLRVAAPGTGEVTGTMPRAGAHVAQGDTVQLRLRGRGDG